MRSLSVSKIKEITDCEVLQQGKDSFSSLGFDTRKDLNDLLFVALKGDAHDAHQYLDKAVNSGAAGLLVHDSGKLPQNSKITILKVKDTLRALHQIATFVRQQNPAKVLGIAGSNGKTTSKEFSAAVIGSCLRTHYSKGSFNNHWGVPFSILAAPEDTEVTILEMGMNHAGELALLAQIAQPDAVVVTYVGIEHIEHFGSLENIAKAEEEIYTHAPESAQRIYNLDNTFTSLMYQKAKQAFPKAQRLWTFSSQKYADVTLKVDKISMESLHVTGSIGGVSGQSEVPVFGKHNLGNLMVAATSALAVGLTGKQIWEALPLCGSGTVSTWGRNQLLQTKSGAKILFDAYNANPDSMRALLDNLQLLPRTGKRIAVLGQMRELGNHAVSAHEQLGAWFANSGFDLIHFVGEDEDSFSRGLKNAGYNNSYFGRHQFDPALAMQIGSELSGQDTVVVKGSRGVELERFVDFCQPIGFSKK